MTASDGSLRLWLSARALVVNNSGFVDIWLSASVGDASGGTRNISAFIADAKTPDLTIGKNERKLGLNGRPNAPVHLENVSVPAENRVGEEGDGFKISMRILNMNRPTIGAVSVGLAQGALVAKLARVQRRSGIEGHRRSRIVPCH